MINCPKIILINNTWCFWHFTRGQLEHLKQEGFEVIAITSTENLLDGPGELLDAFRKRENIDIYTVPMTRYFAPLMDVKALYAIHKIIKSIKPQIVQAGTPKSGFLAILAASLQANPPIKIYLMRALRFTVVKRVMRVIARFAEMLTCRLADAVLCNSQSTLETALRYNVCAKHKIRMLHNGTGNGVDCQVFNPERFSGDDQEQIKIKFNIPVNSRVMLFVGRVARLKGVHELFEVWENLSQHYLDLHLIMAGPIDKDDPISYEVFQKLEQDKRIHLVGFVKNIVPIYAIADIMMHPSFYEGMPIVVLEASAMRVPVVAFETYGCINAVKSGQTGYLVPYKDVTALTAAIKKLLESPELRKKFGSAGREMVMKTFKPEDIWLALVQEYMQLLNEKSIK